MKNFLPGKYKNGLRIPPIDRKINYIILIFFIVLFYPFLYYWIFLDFVSEKKSMKNLFRTIIPYDKNSKKKKDLNQKLAMMIAKDFQCLSLIEDEGFCDFIKALNPRYGIISRKTLTIFVLSKCYKMAKKI